VLFAGAVAACASIAVGCGAIPGVTGGSGDDPITVMTWAPQDTPATNKPGMPAMAEAYARWVNANGGINGHKLRVLTCNDHNDTVYAAKCARRAADENAVAVVGSYSQHGRSFLAPLEAAGIPYIGGYGVTDDEFSSPLSYPINGGEPALLAGLGQQLGSKCGPVALVRPDTVAGDQLPVLLNAGLKGQGHAAATDQRAAEEATEYSGQTKVALEHATSDPLKQGCVVSALGDRTETFMDSFRRDRQDYPKVGTGTVLGSLDQSLIDSTGGQSSPYEGAHVTGWYPVASDARWNPMRKVIKEQAFGDNRIDPADAGVQTTWIAYNVFLARDPAGPRQRPQGDHGPPHPDPQLALRGPDRGRRLPAPGQRPRHLPGRAQGSADLGAQRVHRRVEDAGERGRELRRGLGPGGHSWVVVRRVSPYVEAIEFHSLAAFTFCAVAVPLAWSPAALWPVLRAWPFRQPFLPLTWSAQAA
jgi:hypothetical protein